MKRNGLIRIISNLGMFFLCCSCLFIKIPIGKSGFINASFASNQSASAGISIKEFSLETGLVPLPIKYTVLLPKDYENSGKSYPFFLYLHGGNAYHSLKRIAYPLIRRLMEDGSIPEMIVATPNCYRSLYMDYKDGSEKWESFIVNEFIPYLSDKFPISKDSKDTFIGGLSMGGLGCLRIGFKYPNKFKVVIAWEPAIEPALEWKDVKFEDRAYRSDPFLEEKFGSPIDEVYWKSNNPSSIANEKANKIRESGVKIYLEVGTRDNFGLFRGTEFLHRILFDNKIHHEYRYVYGADHFSIESLKARTIDGLLFLNRVLKLSEER